MIFLLYLIELFQKLTVFDRQDSQVGSFEGLVQTVDRNTVLFFQFCVRFTADDCISPFHQRFGQYY